MRDVGLRVALRHVQPIRECPDGFRGFTLGDGLACGRYCKLYSLIKKKICHSQTGKCECHIVKSHFAMQMFLRRTRWTHIIRFVSSTSSFGGLNPNRSFGFFFGRAPPAPADSRAKDRQITLPTAELPRNLAQLPVRFDLP
jgi:hypothetical protein